MSDPAAATAMPTCQTRSGARDARPCGRAAEWFSPLGKFWVCVECFREYDPKFRTECQHISTLSTPTAESCDNCHNSRRPECPHGIGLCTATCPSKQPAPVAEAPERVTHHKAREWVIAVTGTMPSWRRDLLLYIDQQEQAEGEAAKLRGLLQQCSDAALRNIDDAERLQKDRDAERAQKEALRVELEEANSMIGALTVDLRALRRGRAATLNAEADALEQPAPADQVAKGADGGEAGNSDPTPTETEAPPATRLVPLIELDLAAEALFDMLHLYAGYNVLSRGPIGLIHKALRVLHPEAQAMLAGGADVSEVRDRFWPTDENGDPIEPADPAPPKPLTHELNEHTWCVRCDRFDPAGPCPGKPAPQPPPSGQGPTEALRKALRDAEYELGEMLRQHGVLTSANMDPSHRFVVALLGCVKELAKPAGALTKGELARILGELVNRGGIILPDSPGSWFGKLADELAKGAGK